MFALEDSWARLHRESPEKARKEYRVNDQRQWRPDEPNDADGIDLPQHCVFAQNGRYLELCNPGWSQQKSVVFGLLLIVPMAFFIIWMWYLLAVYPSIFGRMSSITDYDRRLASIDDYLFGWLVFFPLAAICAFMIFAAFYYMGARSSFLTYVRGRIRFNRITRKVYVLRPSYCGGDKVFDWDRLRALLEIRGDRKGGIGSLALYHPPVDFNDPAAPGEDCIFVGPAMGPVSTPTLWEYIRLYMQEGATVDKIPPNAPADYKNIPRFIPPDYSTFCGKPNGDQYKLEVRPGFLETSMHMLSQVTCSWPKFPKEWQSDSGLGEPEDRPVQTGATMTALVYRANGLLSAADEVELLTQWGTPEALAEAQARVPG